MRLATLGALAGAALAQDWQTWCGKHYENGSPIVPPGGRFPEPVSSETPLVAVRCAQAIAPYLPEDAGSDDVSVLIDLPVRYYQISGAAAIDLSNASTMSVTVSLGDTILATGEVPLNATKHALPFSLSDLEPSSQPRTLTCRATYEDQEYTGTTSLAYLPAPDVGSVTKMDRRTGALLARPANDSTGAYAPVVPVGFYTIYGDYLTNDPVGVAANLSAQGLALVHPVPTFDDSLEAVLDAIEAAGLYLMYDMRGTYSNATSVDEQVRAVRGRKNLLLWYTADEPDGTSDDLNATVEARNLITGLDGGDGEGGVGYHPVSLVLNCQDYYYSEYTAGADIVLQDAYTIGNNVTYSTVWDTVCTEDYGDCGCDNCKGSFVDIATRLDQFRQRNFINGWDLTKSLWTVPQAFGNESYWPRYPTGKEFLVESIIGINHGALGVIPWDDPTPDDIKQAASMLARAMPSMLPYLASPTSVVDRRVVHGVDITLWTIEEQSRGVQSFDTVAQTCPGAGDLIADATCVATNSTRRTLVLAANTAYEEATIAWSDLGLSPAGEVEPVLARGTAVTTDGTSVTFEAIGSGAFIVPSG